jgi:oxygen-dependent protoporphyrinogen oxidase
MLLSSRPAGTALQRIAVVGGGVSGLTAAWLLQGEPEARVTLFEKESSTGGKVRTLSERGYLLDTAANGFMANPLTLQLVAQLGLQEQLLAANRESGRRLLFSGGKLRQLPGGPQEFLRSDLLSLPARLRALAELLVPRAAPGTEETVAAFAARRFGAGFARVLADPLVLGITAGDMDELSLDAAFPRLRQLEEQHGSVLRGFIREQQRARASAAASAAPAGLHSFRAGGLGVLTDALRAQFRGEVLHAEVSSVTTLPGAGYQLQLSDGRQFPADAVILATPAPAAARIIGQLSPAAATLLREIDYAPAQVLGLAFERSEVPHPLDSFGFLVPRGEGVRALGVLFSSSIFADQAPAGQVLLRVIAGGRRDPAFGQLADDAALAAVRADLERTLGITAQPGWFSRIDWPQGIPQFTIGHQQRSAGIRSALQQLPGVELAGNYLEGVSVNDAVASARQAASAVQVALASSKASSAAETSRSISAADSE